jgi:hypothetical protein
VVGAKRSLANVAVNYANMVSKTKGTKRAAAAVAFATASRQNQAVMEAAVEAIATENNRTAVVLRDQGKVREAKQQLESNADYLDKAAKKYKSKKLEDYGNKNKSDSENLDDRSWGKTRKSMRDDQTKNDTQRAW